jgi:hypothetical protein
MRFLHYTLHPDSPIVKVYNRFQHADVICISSATYTQLTYSDPLRFFRILSAQDVTASSGSAVLYRPEKYTLIHYIPTILSVTLVLLDKQKGLLCAVTALTMPTPTYTLELFCDTYKFFSDYVVNMPHIITGDVESESIGEWLKMHNYHDLLGHLNVGPTRFRFGFVPDTTDRVFYKGPVSAMECTTRPLRRPDVAHEGSDHCPIYVYFFFSSLRTLDV